MLHSPKSLFFSFMFFSYMIIFSFNSHANIALLTQYPVSLSGEASFMSNNIFRGESETNNQPGISYALEISNHIGTSLGIIGSTSYNLNTAKSLELEYFIMHSNQLTSKFSYNIGVLAVDEIGASTTQLFQPNTRKEFTTSILYSNQLFPTIELGMNLSLNNYFTNYYYIATEPYTNTLLTLGHYNEVGTHLDIWHTVFLPQQFSLGLLGVVFTDQSSIYTLHSAISLTRSF